MFFSVKLVLAMSGQEKRWRKQARSNLPEDPANPAESETGRSEIAISLEMKIFSERKMAPEHIPIVCPISWLPPRRPRDSLLAQSPVNTQPV